MTHDELFELQEKAGDILIDLEKARVMIGDLLDGCLGMSAGRAEKEAFLLVNDYENAQTKAYIAYDYLWEVKKALETLENDILDRSEGGDAL